MKNILLVGVVAFGLIGCTNNEPANSDQPIDDADRVEAPVDGGPVAEEAVPAEVAPEAAAAPVAQAE